MNIFNQPSYEQMNVQNALLTSIASNVGTGGIAISNWEDVQRLVRMGLADKVFAVGDQFVAKYNGVDYKWDVIGINHDIPTDKKYTKSLTIQAHDCLQNAQFDAPEALYYAETELVAGNYWFTANAINYQFTLVNAVPAGGQIVIETWSAEVPLTVKTYPAKLSIVAIETASVAVGNTGTQLVTINNFLRCHYGSNNYKESAIKQWLNSSASTFTWTPQTNYDRPPTGYTAGFLNLLDADLVSVLGAVDKQVARNTVTDGGGQDLFSDKVFLPSTLEVFGSLEGVTTGESAYPYYSALATNPTNDVLAGRIKYLSGSARIWWLRSPCVTHSYYPRSVHTTGNVSYYSAYNALGLAPACCIV